MPGVNERLAKLEGAFDWTKTVVALLLTTTVLSITVAVGSFVSLSSRMDRLEAGVGALPDKINGNLRDLTATLSQAITAAKQQQPQVILIPAQIVPPTTPAAKP